MRRYGIVYSITGCFADAQHDGDLRQTHYTLLIFAKAASAQRSPSMAAETIPPA